jgi:hypothetical protein
MFVSSASLTVSEPSTVVAGSPSEYAVEPAEVVTTGASLLAATETSFVAMLLMLSTAPPSSTWNDTVRVEVDGSSAVFEKVIERSAAW